MKKSAFTKLSDQFWIDQNKIIGKGQYSEVYKGYYSTLDKIIAVKVIPSKLINQSDWERQIQVMQELRKFKHPYIMQYYGYLTLPQGIYVFIQFCQNGTLAQYIIQNKNISQIKVLTMFNQILEAMVHVNKNNIIHRDLKPQNILLDQYFNTKIADFGLARFSDTIMTKGTGTPIYEAPQMVFNQDYDKKCDVWSVGLILYEMLTGVQFFVEIRSIQGLKQALLKMRDGETVKYSINIQPQWEKITNFMICYDKEKRPTFQKVLNLYKKLQIEMKKKINQKYSYQNEDFDNNENQMKIVQSINPYMNSGKMTKSMQLKIEQQQSYKNLNSLRKYEHFFRIKSDFLTHLTKEFNNNPYPYMKNVYKYILIYLSYSMFICRIQTHIVQLKKRQITLPDKIIIEKDCRHKQQFRKLIEQFQSKFQLYLEKIEEILMNQINSKILNQYSKRAAQKIDLQKISSLLRLDICECIKNTNNKLYLQEHKYQEMYKKLISISDIFVDGQKLNSFQYKDAKTYFYIRLIANLNNFIDDKRYKQDDYILKLKQDLQLKSKNQLIQMIRQFK